MLWDQIQTNTFLNLQVAQN